jgi:hypothetical protein
MISSFLYSSLPYFLKTNPSHSYPSSQKTTGLPLDEYENDCPNGIEDKQYATARCRPIVVADNRVVAEDEDG